MVMVWYNIGKRNNNHQSIPHLLFFFPETFFSSKGGNEVGGHSIYSITFASPEKIRPNTLWVDAGGCGVDGDWQKG